MLNKSRLLAPAALAVAVSLATVARAQTTTATWLSPVSGQWSDPTKWSSNPYYPNNGNPSGSIYDVMINAAGSAYTVSADFMPLTLDTLTIDSASATVNVAKTYVVPTHSFEPLAATTVSILNGTLSADDIIGATISSANGVLVMYDSDGVSDPAYRPVLDHVTVGANLSIQNSYLSAVALTLQNSALHLNATTMNFNGGTLAGGGTIYFDGTDKTATNSTLTNLTINPDVTVLTGTSGGNIGAPNTAGAPNLVTNNGTITASLPGAWINVRGSGFVNNGLLQAINGGAISLEGPFTNNGAIRVTDGTLQLTGAIDLTSLSSIQLSNANVIISGGLDNTGNTLNVHDASRTLLLGNGGSISGGTIASPDGSSLTVAPGLVAPYNSTFSLQNLVLKSPLLVPATLNPPPSPRYLPRYTIVLENVDVRAPISVAGGNVQLYNNVSINAPINVTGGQLTIDAMSNNAGITATDNSLIYVGRFPAAVGNITLTDSTLVLDTAAYVTQSQIAAFHRVNSSVVLSSYAMNNSGQTLILDGGAAWYLTDDFTISGGTIVASEQSPLYIGWKPTGAGTLSGVTFAGPMMLGEASLLMVTNSLTLDHAKITLTSTSLGTTDGIEFQGGPQSLNGSGEIIFDNDPTLNTPSTISTQGTLTIGGGIYIHSGTGYGTIGSVVTAGTVISDGIISADTYGVRVIGSILNNGLFRATNGGSFTVYGEGNLQNLVSGTLTGGTYEVDDKSVFVLYLPSPTGANVPASIATNAATILLSGPNSHFDALNALAVNQGSFTITAGRQFTTAGKLENGGTLAIGDHSLMTVAGDLSLDPASVLDLTLTSTADTLLEIQGTAILDGTLRITLANGYEPAPGDAFQLFTASAYNGNFASLDLPALPNGEQWVTDDLSQGQLSVTPEPAAVGVLGVLAAGGLLRRRRSVVHVVA